MKKIWKRAGPVLAIAAFGTMGTAQAYEWQFSEDTMFAITGDVEIDYVIEDQGIADDTRELEDGGSEIEFKGSHAFTDTVTGYFEVEVEYTADEDSNVVEIDESYVGLRGNFGAVQVGRFDNLYDDTVNDLVDIFEVGDPTESKDSGDDNSVAYFSPDFNGFSFAVQALLLGEDNDPDPDNDGQSFAAVLSYETERFGVYLGYDDLGLQDVYDYTYGLGGGLNLAPVTLTARIASTEADHDMGFMVYGIAAEYDYGRGSIIGLVNQVEPDADSADSRTELGLQVNFDVYDGLSVYAEHFRYDMTDDLGNTTAVGVIYEF